MGWQDAPIVERAQTGAQPKWASAPVVGGARPYNPFSNDESALPPLPGEETYDAFEKGSARPGYVARVNEAARAVDRAKPTGGLGTLEALATLATGGVAAPILGTAESIALGTEPEESFARYTYQPRTESGKAQIGLLGEVASPLTESGADIALLPLAAESQALSSVRHVPGTPKAKLAPAPSKAELASKAQDAYRRAERAGVVISPASFVNAAGRIRANLRKQGFSEKLHPRVNAALQEIEGTQGSVNLEQAEILRRIAKSAESSIEPDERRVGSLLVDELDDYMESLTPRDIAAGDSRAAVGALHEARNLWSRKRKSDEIDELIRRAELSAPNFSASGMENALRTEFRSLAKNERRMRRFTPEERAAIERVVKGGLAENALRLLGKLAPTGVISGSLSAGGGFAVGGPLGAAAVPAAGLAGRIGATAMTKRNARLAEALMRRGPAQAAQAPSVASPAATGELMPRAPLALPAPNIIAGTRSAPGTAFAREQIGITPDVERAGALHPGAARQSLLSGAPALPYRAAPAAVADQRPMVVDLAGRVARTQQELSNYLRQTGQDRMRNVRKPNVGPMPQRLAQALARADQPRGGRSIEQIQADLVRLDARIQRLPPDEPLESVRAQALEAEYARLREELAAAGVRQVS